MPIPDATCRGAQGFSGVLNEWRAEYRKGKAKATLSVKDKKGRVEVRLKEGD